MNVKLSLRKRFIFGTGFMLVPLILLGVIGYILYIHTIDSFNSVMEQTFNEMVPVNNIQRRIIEATLPIDNHLILQLPENQDIFVGMSHLLDQDFDNAVRIKFRNDDDRQWIIEARSKWHETQKLGLAILRASSPTSDPDVIDNLSAFDTNIKEIVQILDKVHEQIQYNIGVSYQQALQTQKQVQVLLFVILCFGIIAAVIVGSMLARKILRPIYELKEGTERFGAGDLRHRIVMDSRDELGLLANTFNHMADELEHLASRDSLTGLLNKREFDKRLKEETKRATRTHHPLALLILDLDHFKRVNDDYGHPCGDKVLRVLAALISKQVREIDYVARYGGEEFAVIMAEASEDDAMDAAERIRQTVENHAFTIREDKILKMTVSVGFAMYPDDAANENVLISCADQALYNAKGEGRNRVRYFGEL